MQRVQDLLAELPEGYRTLDRDVGMWVFSRPWELLWVGVPSLLLAAFMCLAAAYEARGWDESALRRYKSQLDFARAQSNQVAVRLLAHKISQMTVAPEEKTYAQAVLAEDRGQRELASQLMHQVAPVDRAGDPRAHYWVAEQIRAVSGPRTAAQDKELLHHLEQAAGHDGSQHTAHLLLAEMLRKEGQLEQAAVHLEAVVAEQPEARLDLSDIYLELGELDRATEHLDRAAKAFEKRVNSEAGDIESRLLWARALAGNTDFEGAERVLRDRLTYLDRSRAPARELASGRSEAARLEQALVDVYVAWTDDVLEHSLADRVPPLPLLQKALSRAADDPRILSRIGRVLAQPGPIGEQANVVVSQAIESKTMPASVRLAMGMAAAARGDVDAARQHWQTEAAAAAQTSALLNQMIQELISVRPPQNELALQVADAAVQAWPQDADLRETRGVLLAGAERWPDSLADLQQALEAHPDRPAIHRQLAEVHEKLGDRQLAAKHRELAEQFGSQKN